MMDRKLFAQLATSLEQMGEITRGERAPSRTTIVDAVKVKEVRAMTGLSQANFASIIDVQLSTLRNWEQGRRAPTGPARALIRAIERDPKNVLRALAPSS